MAKVSYSDVEESLDSTENTEETIEKVDFRRDKSGEEINI